MKMNKTHSEILEHGSIILEVSSNGSAKQPYNSPKMKEYGDLREITMAIGTRGNSDGGILPPLNRTSLL